MTKAGIGILRYQWSGDPHAISYLISSIFLHAVVSKAGLLRSSRCLRGGASEIAVERLLLTLTYRHLSRDLGISLRRL